MKAAKDIYELADNLFFQRPLSREDENDVFVDMYSSKIALLKEEIIRSKVSSQSFYVAGQSGTGKSSALNFLPSGELYKKYHVKYLVCREMLDLNDVDIIDILLMISYILIKESDKLQEEFFDEITKIQEKHTGELSETIENSEGSTAEVGVKASIGAGVSFLGLIKSKIDFFWNLRADSAYRKVTRRAFVFKIHDLSELVNKIISRYEEIVLVNKRLLLVIDDLEKIKKADLIKNLFIDNGYLLEGLDCKKVISIPVHLTTMPQFYHGQFFIQFIVKLSENKLLDEMSAETKNEISDNSSLMHDIIYKRIHKDSDLISEEAIDLAIDKSGGIIRQFVEILYKAATFVRLHKGIKISENDVQKAWQDLARNMSSAVISTEKITLLNKVLIDNVPISQDNDGFIEALLGNQIIKYENQPPWYELNPLIENTVKIYASRLKD